MQTNVSLSEDLLHHLTRREKKHARKLLRKNKGSFNIRHIEPKTRNQKLVFEAYREGQNIL